MYPVRAALIQKEWLAQKRLRLEAAPQWEAPAPPIMQEACRVSE